MSDQGSAGNRGFVEQQRKRLEALRKQLSGTEASQDARERVFRKEHGGEAKEFEDEAQNMAENEIDEAIHRVDDRRLRAIDRALAKIGEGTYGLSDMSGKPIPKARLEATPEAVLTVEEEEQREKQQRR